MSLTYDDFSLAPLKLYNEAKVFKALKYWNTRNHNRVNVHEVITFLILLLVFPNDHGYPLYPEIMQIGLVEFTFVWLHGFFLRNANAKPGFVEKCQSVSVESFMHF